jgi:hypothetical protein
VDDSDSDTDKFYIGNSTSYLNWNGTSLDITAGRTLQVYEAGEDITIGDSVCLGRGVAVDGTDGQLVAESNAFIDSYYPDNNDNDSIRVQDYDGFPNGAWSQWGLIKFDLNDYTDAFGETRLYLRIACGNINAAGQFDINIYPITTAWSADTVTWNTIPTIGDLIGTITVSRTDGTLWKYIDLTTYLMKVKLGIITGLYGFMLKGTQYNTTGQGYVTINTRLYDGYEPAVRGRKLIYADKLFRANSSVTAGNTQEYRCYNFIGIATESVSSGTDCRVQVSGVYDGMSGLVAGEDYYIGENLGAISETQDVTISVPLFKIGRAISSTKLMIEKGEKGDSFIFPSTYFFTDSGYTYTYIPLYFKPTEVEMFYSDGTYQYIGRYINQKQHCSGYESYAGDNYVNNYILNRSAAGGSPIWIQIHSVKNGGIYLKSIGSWAETAIGKIKG